MNTELKALVVLCVDAYKAVGHMVHKDNFLVTILPALYHVGKDAKDVIANWGDLQAEISALPGSEQERDLSAFIVSEFGDLVSGDQAKAILNAVLKLVTDVANDAIALEKAIKG